MPFSPHASIARINYGNAPTWKLGLVGANECWRLQSVCKDKQVSLYEQEEYAGIKLSKFTEIASVLVQELPKEHADESID